MGHAPDPASSTFNSRQRRVLLGVLAAVFYALLILAILHFKLIGHQTLSMLLLYLYGILGGYGIVIFRQIYASADRGRKILNEVLEKSNDARLVTNAQDDTIYCNTRFRDLVNKQNNPTLKDFAGLFSASDKIQPVLRFLKDKATASGTATDEISATIDQKRVRFLITCQLIEGWPGYFQWRIEDITHRYQMETAVREEREKLRDFTDHAPVGFFSVDENGIFQFANDTFCRLLGMDSSMLVGRARLHDFLASPPRGAKPYDCFDTGGSYQHGELLIKGAGGRLFKASITHSVTRDEEGKIIARSVIYDLTAEQLMQKALQESEDRFQRLFEEAPVGICMLSSGGVISSANQTLAGMMRLPLEAINGRPLTHFVPKENLSKLQDWLAKITGGEKKEGHIDLVLKGSATVFTQIYARKFAMGDSVVMHFIDLTEQKNLERQFTQSQKMQAVGQLAGGVAHDFNNLLTAMIGFCDLLLLRHKPGDASFADIMQIKQNANRAANLVRQLLAFSRQQTLQPRTLDLTDVLTELSHLMRRLIGANIELQLTHSSDIGLIRADQGQIEQVLINLVVNARDAMPQGGKLFIRTRNVVNQESRKISHDETLPAGKWVVVEVEDTGTGIPADIQTRIFEPFFSTKEVGAGTGLGLATVHGIVHQTGGFIGLQSTVGKGTTFTIYLPPYAETAADKKAAEVSEERQTTRDLTGYCNILLVEDEDAVRTFSARALTNKGYKVAEAPSGAAALRILEEGKFQPEILVTDVMMPEMDGTTLARIVKDKYPHIKIIFISGYAEDRFKEHLGADVHFLPKPFTLKQLATKVKEVIEDSPSSDGG